MNPKEFSEKINELGELRVCNAGNNKPQVGAYQDRVFVPQATIKSCPDCGLRVENRTLEYDVKFNHRGQAHWRTRCLVKDCGEKWPELRL